MAEWQSGDVRANGITIHYTRTGGDKPPVVLNHGSTDSGLCWTPVARALEADYDVIMPDARGHGLSDAPESGYDHETRAADLASFIEALKLERPVVGGHSMGASQTLRFAAAYPDMLRAAILEDGGIRLPGWTPPGRGAPGDALKYKEMTREELIAHARRAHPTWAEEELGPWADSKLQVSPRHVVTLEEHVADPAIAARGGGRGGRSRPRTRRRSWAGTRGGCSSCPADAPPARRARAQALDELPVEQQAELHEPAV